MMLIKSIMGEDNTLGMDGEDHTVEGEDHTVDGEDHTVEDGEDQIVRNS
jgi:hypothetical protein